MWKSHQKMAGSKQVAKMARSVQEWREETLWQLLSPQHTAQPTQSTSTIDSIPLTTTTIKYHRIPV
jgi:hypothetical protein